MASLFDAYERSSSDCLHQSRWISALAFCVVAFCTLSVSPVVHSKDIELLESFAGNLDFMLKGNTFRTGGDVNGCAPLSSSSASLDLPAGSSIRAAYLYWSGSGSEDTSVSLNGSPVNSDVTYDSEAANLTFYSARANITGRIQSNGIYTVSGLEYDDSATYCNVGGAYGGWALLVIFENNNEPFRVVNLYDGYQSYQGSSITLNPSNFQVSQNPAVEQGSIGLITWEGDTGNSQELNGFAESVVFNGNTLQDASNPPNNQFNSFSNTTPGDTSGVDLDSYPIGQFLTPGQTNVTTTYSSGQDLVFLTAEIVSIPNVPVSDLALGISGPSQVSRGADVTVTFNTTNNGPLDAPTGSVIRFPINDGVSLTGSAGNNWSCLASNGEVVCTYDAVITSGDQAPTLSVTLSTAATTQSEFTVDASLEGINFDNRLDNNRRNLTIQLRDADLSNSVKDVVDLNGGRVEPGDTLRYTIDIVNGSNFDATDITLNDSLPASISSFNVVSPPAGSTDNSQPSPAGDNSSGLVLINDISIAANTSVSVIIDAVISATAQDGSTITNEATVGNPFSNTTVRSPTVVVSNAFNNSGNKPLYLQPNSTLRRIADTSGDFQVINGGQTVEWTLTPALQTDLRLDYSNGIPLTLLLQNDFPTGLGNARYQHELEISLVRVRNGDRFEIANIAGAITLSDASSGQITTVVGTLGVVNEAVLLTGDELRLSITQDVPLEFRGNRRRLRVYASNNGEASRIDLTSNTVISVDRVAVFDNSFPNGNEVSILYPGFPYFIRAQVTDPFGAYDITDTRLTIDTASGDQPVSLEDMQTVETTSASITAEYQYTTPEVAQSEDYIFTVRADEGFEGTVFNTRSTRVPLIQPARLTLDKSLKVIEDPINLTANPKAIPGAVVQYQLKVTNTGEGTTDNDTVTITDELPQNTIFFVGTDASVNPLTFVDGSPASTLTINFENLTSANDDVEFSNNNGTTFDYQPTANAEGFDPLISDVRVRFTGAMPGSDQDSSPEFSIFYKVKVN